LPGHIAAEGKPYRGFLRLGRRGPERSARGGPATAEADSVEVPPGGGQAVEADLAGPVVRGFHGNWFDPPVRPPGQPHLEDSAAVPSGPQHRRPRRDITHDNPVTHRGAVVAAQSRGGAAGKNKSRGHQR
jgi:hypothetical protein